MGLDHLSKQSLVTANIDPKIDPSRDRADKSARLLKDTVKSFSEREPGLTPQEISAALRSAVTDFIAGLPIEHRDVAIWQIGQVPAIVLDTMRIREVMQRIMEVSKENRFNLPSSANCAIDGRTVRDRRAWSRAMAHGGYGPKRGGIRFR
jgi:light-regulated signal transduction histidine kinase (bacteriophytochrome)